VIRENKLYGAIHIAESWTYFPKGKNDHTFKQVAQGEMRVSDLKPEDRTEALMVSVEGRDGAARLWLSPIVRSPSGAALGAPIEMDQPPAGRFGRLFA
jgi:hypothetical protein